MRYTMGLLRSRLETGLTQVAMLACAVLSAAASGPGIMGLAPAASADLGTWPTYRNDQYGFELRYPPDYAIVQPRQRPQLAPLFRVWFKEAALASSPIADREPPQFAVDVYDNASQRPLDTWLVTSGAARDLARVAREAVQVGGVQGLRLTDQMMLAPNTFYYVARGPFVYRFTPLGRFSDQMLASVRFTA